MYANVLLDPQPWPKGSYKLVSVCPSACLSAHFSVDPSVCPSVSPEV